MYSHNPVHNNNAPQHMYSHNNAPQHMYSHNNAPQHKLSTKQLKINNLYLKYIVQITVYYSDYTPYYMIC